MGSRDGRGPKQRWCMLPRNFKVFHVEIWCNAIIKAQASVCMSPSVTSIVSEQAVCGEEGSEKSSERKT